MDGVLHGSGALGVGIVLLVVALFLLGGRSKRGGKSIVRGVATKVVPRTPARIHLIEVPAPRSARVKPECDKAVAAGFTDLGTFHVKEMPQVVMHAFAKPAESSYCVVYEHSAAGMWIDMVTKYADNTGLTVGNAPRGGELDVRPGQKKVKMKGADLPALYQRLVAERDSKPLAPVNGSKEEFVQVFERAYADEMDWRNSRGGVTEDEIRRVAAASGRTVSERTVKTAEALRKQQACEDLIVAFEECLREKNGYASQQWAEMRPRLVFVHDGIPFETLREMVGKYMQHSVVGLPAEMLPHTTVRELFRAVNAGLPADKRLEVLTVVEKPVEADVYVVHSARKSPV